MANLEYLIDGKWQVCRLEKGTYGDILRLPDQTTKPYSTDIETRLAPLKPLVTTAEAAELLGLSTKEVLKLIHAGKLPVQKTYKNAFSGKSYLLTRESVLFYSPNHPETATILASEVITFAPKPSDEP
jgi:excisionase family DNA binding protein